LRLSLTFAAPSITVVGVVKANGEEAWKEVIPLMGPVGVTVAVTVPEAPEVKARV
jgi:hypothetical protein